MKPIPRLRLSVRLTSVVVLGFASWLLFVPRIALYDLDQEGQPYEVDVKYAWGRGTSDQMLTMSTAFFDEEDQVVPTDPVSGTVTSVRLNCGLVFTSGDNETEFPGGTAACAEIETPRLVGGLGLALFGITGLGVAGRLPTRRGGEHVPGGEDLFRFDDLPKPRHSVLGEGPEDRP